MKGIITISLILISIITFAKSTNDTIVKQENKIYTSAGGEWIFSSVNTNTEIEDPSMRFSAWFHMQFHWHYDFTNNIGAFLGLGSRNIGYITKPKTNNVYIKGFTKYNYKKDEYELSNNYTSDQKITAIKRREYTIGIPLGFKFGDFNNNIFGFFGGEIEFPFNYKNKVYVDGIKVFKDSRWFSKETNSYFLSIFAGIQLPWGTNLKFKWYLNDFMNTNYSTKETVDVTDPTGKPTQKTVDVTPYSAIKSQVFYISFGMNMFSSKKAVKQIQSIDKQKKDSYDL